MVYACSLGITTLNQSVSQKLQTVFYPKELAQSWANTGHGVPVRTPHPVPGAPLLQPREGAPCPLPLRRLLRGALSPLQKVLQLRCLKAAVTCRGQCRKEVGWREEGGRQVYSYALPEHSFTQPIYSKSGSMIYCKLKHNTKISHRLVTSSPDHFNTDRSNSVAELDPVSFTSTHCYRHSFRELLVKTTAADLHPWGRRRLGKQTQKHCGVQSAEWRCNLSSKVSGLFLPMLFSVVRDVSLAFKREGVGKYGKGKWAAVHCAVPI